MAKTNNSVISFDLNGVLLMRKSLIIICMVITLSVAASVSAYEQDRTSNYEPLLFANEIVINPHDWDSFPIACSAGDTLSGEFLITHNGELFPGDQTEYDNWLLGGIDFYVFDEENYSSWVEGSFATPLLERLGLQELTWSIEIPYNDVWYVVYSNDSLYIIEIEESIVRSGLYDQFVLVITLVGIAALLSLTIFMLKKK
ncbi:MAG: hypothetical protein ACW98U_02995 [Candidatus Thorarchaeota archaeon]